MKKIYQTSKTKQELLREMTKLSLENGNIHRDKELWNIWIKSTNEVRVGTGRGQTFWNLDFNKDGQIAVKRIKGFTDWLLVITYILIDIIMLGLVIYNDAILVGLGSITILVLVEVITTYGLYELSPIKHINRFVEKYLGVY